MASGVGRVETAVVRLWGERVGAVAWDAEREVAVFEFDPDFGDHGWDVAPLTMPLAQARGNSRRFSFRTLPRDTYRGLPGLLADSLPDRFGNNLIDAWLARQGRTPDSFSPIERLCYTGRRGVGALEFEPPLQRQSERSVPVEVAELVALAQQVTSERTGLQGDLAAEPADAILDILRVGTSAGGGRPKAVVAVNETTGEVRSGQVDAPPGFAHWLLKFDGVDDSELGPPAGYGRVEYAYHLMAVAGGIEMMPCRLLEEGGRAHFMTRRFDRPAGGGKRHLQSLCAIAHFDFNDPAAWSYEQSFQVMRELRLPYPDLEQQFRRTVFNLAARNQDDHTKNIAFLLDRDGRWRLSPAYDLTWAYNPRGRWTRRHQMSVGGKRDGFERSDLLQLAIDVGLKRGAAVVDEVTAAVRDWARYAATAGVGDERCEAIGRTHRRLGD